MSSQNLLIRESACINIGSLIATFTVSTNTAVLVMGAMYPSKGNGCLL